MHSFRANDQSYSSENPRAVCMFVSSVLIPSSTNRRVDSFASRANSICTHLPAGIYLLPTARWNLAIAITSYKKLNPKNDRKFFIFAVGFWVLNTWKRYEKHSWTRHHEKNLYLTHLQDACEGGNTRAPSPSSRAPRAFFCARHNSYAQTRTLYPLSNQCCTI